MLYAERSILNISQYGLDLAIRLVVRALIAVVHRLTTSPLYYQLEYVIDSWS